MAKMNNIMSDFKKDLEIIYKNNDFISSQDYLKYNNFLIDIKDDYLHNKFIEYNKEHNLFLNYVYDFPNQFIIYYMRENNSSSLVLDKMIVSYRKYKIKMILNGNI